MRTSGALTTARFERGTVAPPSGRTVLAAHPAVDLPINISLTDRVQHDYRYLAFGLELIIGVRWPKFERFFPKLETFLALRCPGSRLHLLGPDLYLDIRVGEDIAVPS